jgi:4-amino-4-deoxy-L-arabinose transferase-like glycosyltransferase
MPFGLILVGGFWDVERLTGGFRPYLLLSLLCLMLYLPGLATVPPLDRDESRFVQATRQMLESGDFVRIQFQKEMRAKKPVGAYWLQAASVSLFSDPASRALWPYRLPSALAAWAAVLMTFAFAHRIFTRPVALLGAALLGSCLMLVSEAHQAKTDAILLACTVAAQGALARFYVFGRLNAAVSGQGGSCGSGGCSSGAPAVPAKALEFAPGVLTALVFWVAQGFAILVKGPVVPMISLLTILALVIADRRAGWLVGLRPLTGSLVAISIAAPWFVAISSATGGAFVGEAVKSDLLPKLLGAQESHGGLPGTFLLLVSATLWPASLLLWPALVRGWHDRLRPQVRFCLAWIIPSWIMFELIPTKLPHYVLPTYPALALLIAAAVMGGAEVLRSRPAKGWYAVWTILAVALAAAMVVLPLRYGSGLSWVGVASAVALVAAAVFAVWQGIRGNPRNSSAALVLVAVIAFPAVFAGVLPRLDSLWVSRNAAALVDSLPHSGAVAAAGYNEPSLVVMLGTDTMLIDGAAAADYLAHRIGALALVSDREDEAFRRAATGQGLAVRVLGTVSGFNYSRGRPVTVTAYAAGGGTP